MFYLQVTTVSVRPRAWPGVVTYLLQMLLNVFLLTAA